MVGEAPDAETEKHQPIPKHDLANNHNTASATGSASPQAIHSLRQRIAFTMTDSVNRLFGSCACQRNVYEINIPHRSTSLASVFFDNSLSSRRSQASPLAVWLRVPLDFYHSTTVAQFPDETHASIRRTFNSQHPRSLRPTVRRQFCGYCGTHLTAYDQTQPAASPVIDVTLGSLFEDSLQELEALNILPDGLAEDPEQPSVPADGLVKGGSIDDETHIPSTATPADGLVKGGTIDNETHIPETAKQEQQTEHAAALQIPSHATNNMTNRGIPYFEEMIENSSLGRIKRQMGGHVSADGSTTVQWEIVEFEADEEMADASPTSQKHASKRIKVNS